MLRVALTGGIGSGKSTVTALFGDWGVPIVDADKIARTLVAPGQPALASIAQRFGAQMLNADGSLNRRAMREAIFADPENKRQLEALLHPLIYQRIDNDLAILVAPYVIVAVPLLVETGEAQRFDRILVVDCPVEIQLQRVMQRDKVDKEQVLSMIAAQASRAQRLAYADDVIDNSGAASLLAEPVKKLHNFYIHLGTSKALTA